jgi:hypothetical protein
VWPNRDGAKDPCGGPGPCAACTADAVAQAKIGEFARDQRAHQYAGDPAIAQMLELMKNQVLIVLVNRLGGAVEIPAAEIDACGAWMMELHVDQETRAFSFQTAKKQ